MKIGDVIEVEYQEPRPVLYRFLVKALIVIRGVVYEELVPVCKWEEDIPLCD